MIGDLTGITNAITQAVEGGQLSTGQGPGNGYGGIPMAGGGIVVIYPPMMGCGCSCGCGVGGGGAGTGAGIPTVVGAPGGTGTSGSGGKFAGSPSYSLQQAIGDVAGGTGLGAANTPMQTIRGATTGGGGGSGNVVGDVLSTVAQFLGLPIP
jgi:hypothetical protein